MGAIKVAVPSKPVTTQVGKEKIVSLVFFSCEKTRGKIAIELANAPESDAKGGLPPRQMPRLVCNLRGDGATAKSELATSWRVSEIGDALARGLSPSTLRRCASIDVVQNIALPGSWARASQRIEIELIPYQKELDSVLSECGATVATAPTAPAPPAPRDRIADRETTPPPAPDRTADASWKRARTLAKGRTNLRSSPSLDSAVVRQLDRNLPILVQRATSEWWKVKPLSGEAFSGYIRQDRLVIE